MSMVRIVAALWLALFALPAAGDDKILFAFTVDKFMLKINHIFVAFGHDVDDGGLARP